MFFSQTSEGISLCVSQINSVHLFDCSLEVYFCRYAGWERLSQKGTSLNVVSLIYLGNHNAKVVYKHADLRIFPVYNSQCMLICMCDDVSLFQY